MIIVTEREVNQYENDTNKRKGNFKGKMGKSLN